jgi:acyl-CoA dehydrogenase
LIIGGEKMAGHGWRMLMECLSAGHALLPSATAGATVLRVTSAYARIRASSVYPCRAAEGVEEPLVRIIETAYVTRSCPRAMTAAMVSRGEAIGHFGADEIPNDRQSPCRRAPGYSRRARHLRRPSITVVDLPSGSGRHHGRRRHILTRTLITFAQAAAALASIYKEVQAARDLTANAARRVRGCLRQSHCIRFECDGAFVHNVTGGALRRRPEHAPDIQLVPPACRASRSYAFVADNSRAAAAAEDQPEDHRRMADALSELYMLAATLKRYDDDGRPAGDEHIVTLAAKNALHRFQEAIGGTIDNFPAQWARPLMRAVVFPLGRRFKPASDALGHKVAKHALQPGEERDRLTRHIFISKDVNDPTGILEVTLEKVIAAEPAEKKLEKAIRDGLHCAVTTASVACRRGKPGRTTAAGPKQLSGSDPRCARHRGRPLIRRN